MLKKIILSSMLAATTGLVSAQSLTPVFKDIDYGQMLFMHPAYVTIDVKNTSSQPVQIKKVDTSCGCTEPSFSRAELQPGEIGKVNLAFDCKQLGHFSRIIRVYDSASDTPSEIKVSGQVVTKVENYAGDYPYKLGNLLVDVAELEFDDVNKGQRFVREIHIMNPTGQNVTPVLLRLPSYMKTEMHPEVIGPKQKGTMYVTLNSGELRDYGLIQTSVYLGQNSSDKISPQKEISVSTIVLPPTSSKDEVSPYAPKISLSSKVVDMTALSKKKKAKDEIVITNKGRSVLEISKIQLFTAGLEVSVGNMRIEPGESTRLKVTGVASDLKKTRIRPRILLITNDPNHQKVLLEVKR